MAAPVWPRTGRGAPVPRARPAPTRASPARMRRTTSVDPRGRRSARACPPRRWSRTARRSRSAGSRPACSASARRRGSASARPLPPIGIQPSALGHGGESTASVAPPPISVRTRGCWTRLGPRPGRAEVDELAVELGLSSDQMASMAARCSRTMSCRRPKSTPWSSASARFQPKPTPSVTRPPERWSSVATCLASTIGSCWAASRMPVPEPDARGHGGSGGQRDERVETALVIVEAHALDERRRDVLPQREVGVLGQPERVEAELLDRRWRARPAPGRGRSARR